MSDALITLIAVLSFVWLPLTVDFLPALRARTKRVVVADGTGPTYDDFAVLVPIYGDIAYLANVDLLCRYGSRVVLTTTDRESDRFYADLAALSDRHGFRVVRAHIESRGACNGKRCTTSPIRDVIVREAVRTIPERYVVCLDADTFPKVGFEYLFGAMEQHGFEVASTRLVPSNRERLLGRLQVIEYWLAMNLRRIAPWLVSGGCHAATTEAYTQIMNRHSMFFQGNDVEVGLLGDRMGYRVGHVAYEVATEVPDRPKPWWRQRWAWSGGEWRLAVTNVKFAVFHPFFFCYATVVMIAMCPLRWYCVIVTPWVLLLMYALYLVLISLLVGRSWTWVCLLYPVYTLMNSLVMVALGSVSYVQMSVRHRNWGRIVFSPGPAVRTPQHETAEHRRGRGPMSTTAGPRATNPPQGRRTSDPAAGR